MTEAPAAQAVPLEEVLMQFLYRAPVGLLQTSLDGTVQLINPKAAQLLMPLATDARLDNLFDVLRPFVQDLHELVASCGEATGTVFENLHVAVGPRAGGAETYQLSAIKIDDARLMIVVEDVTGDLRRERHAMDRRLHAAARVDALTLMPNQVAFAELLAAAMYRVRADGERVVVLMVGFERLSHVDTTLGHAVKDQVLDGIARRLCAALRLGERAMSGDPVRDVVARADGDEFLILLYGSTSVDVVARIAQRLLDALTLPHVVDAHRLHCAGSIGIVPVAGDDVSVDPLLRDASVALAEAKRAGPGRWVLFDQDMRLRALSRATLETDLRSALAEDELFVVYQPVVALQSAPGDGPRAFAVEALVRWRHPTRGVVPPIEFIGAAEENGLIAPIGAWVLATACRSFMSWQGRLGDRAPTLLAVNLSRAQLADPSIVAAVRETLASCAMPPHRLQLEVTESLAAQDDGVQAQLHALKALGVRIALDDFGTGYSSLSSLHLLPVDTLKIDRSFVHLIDTSPHHRALIQATIYVAKSLGLSTVAEGIETAGQAAVLTRMGVEKGQGYWYARPLDAQAIDAWLTEEPVASQETGRGA